MAHPEFPRPPCGRRAASLRLLLPVLASVALPAAALDITVDVLNDPVPNGCTTGSCSLREAISLANSLSGPDRILLPATPTLPLQLSIPGASENANVTGDLDVLDDLEIIGTGAATTTLVQTTPDRLLESTMAVGKKLVLRGLTLQGGSSVSGGAVSSRSILVVEDAAFIGNRATVDAGAIRHTAGLAPEITEPRLVLRRVTFDGNEVTGSDITGQGGAVFGNSFLTAVPYALIEDCVFNDNSATKGGGALLLSGNPNQYGGTVVIRRSLFTANRNDDAGGAAISLPLFSAFDVLIEDSLFDGNVTSVSGAGAVDLATVGPVRVVRTTFSKNQGEYAGALRVRSSAQVIDSHFLGNSAERSGGAFVAGGSTLVERSTFEANDVTSTNTTDGGGGAISFSGTVLGIQRSTFSGNDAFRGGAIALAEGQLQVYGSTLVAPASGIAGRQATLLRILDDTTSSLAIANSVFNGNCTFPSAGRQLAVAYNNVESPLSSCRFTTAALRAGNLVFATPGQINLAALADNGGPTPTHLPRSTSVVIDAGRESYCTATDQRRFARNDAACDIGAVERGAISDMLFENGFD